MASSVTELILKFKGDSGDLKSTIAQVRAELTQTAQTQKVASQGELSIRNQLSAAQSLQRQRSAALISQWKQQETAAKQLATGVLPLGTNLQKITDVMQALGSSTATLQGPFGGVASRLRSLGSIATEAGGGLGIVATGIAALAVGAVAAAAAITKITISTAEFQGKLFDLSQQTGVMVETLSTLEFAARTSGGNLDSATNSLVLFQTKIEEAQDPTSETAEKFRELGITANDTEGALRQAFAALAKLPEGFHQTNEAAELFGRRGAKQFLGMLKDTNGNIDLLTAKLRAAGALVTGEVAAAADKFNDTLVLLEFQIRGITAIIGNEAMPIILKALEDFSALLIENRQLLASWGEQIGDAGRGAIIAAGHIATLSGQISGLGNLPVPSVLLFLAQLDVTGLSAIFRGLRDLGAASRPPEAGADAGVTLGIPGTTTRKKKGAGKAKTSTFLQDATKEADLTEREALSLIEEKITENKRALEEQERSIEAFTKRAIELEDERQDAAIVRINKEQLALETALAKKLITRKEFETKDRELSLENSDAAQKNSEETFKLEQERDRKISAAQLAAKQRELQIVEEADARQIKRIQDRVDGEILSESEGERQIGAIILQGLDRRKKALEEEQVAYATTLERRQVINGELIRLDGERAFSAEETAKRVAKAQFDEQNIRAQGATRPRIVGAPPTDVFRELGSVISETMGLGAEQAQAFGSIISSTFSEIGSAVGEAVKAFVLFGSAQGSFKKFAAEVIASIAQMAAVQAVFELAQGLAMLALGYFFPNVKYFQSAGAHFAAAAAFGAIAVGAAGVGRAVAGNSFNKTAEGGVGAGGGEPGPAPRRLEPRDIDRQGGRATIPTINLNVNVTRDEGSTVRAVIDDYRGNGAVRRLILTDGQA